MFGSSAPAEPAKPAVEPDPTADPTPVEPPVEDDPAEVERVIGEGDHVGTIWTSAPSGKLLVNRECSCGWAGALVSTHAEADAEFAEHI